MSLDGGIMMLSPTMSPALSTSWLPLVRCLHWLHVSGWRHVATDCIPVIAMSVAGNMHVSGWRHVVTVYITPIQSWLLLWMETCHWLLLHWHTRAGISRCSLHNNCTSSDFQLRTIPAVLAAPAPHPVSLSLPPQPPISMDSLCEQSIPSSVSIAALSLAFSRQECEFMPCLVHFVVLLVLVWYGSVSCFVIVESCTVCYSRIGMDDIVFIQIFRFIWYESNVYLVWIPCVTWYSNFSIRWSTCIPRM